MLHYESSSSYVRSRGQRVFPSFVYFWPSARLWDEFEEGAGNLGGAIGRAGPAGLEGQACRG